MIGNIRKLLAASLTLLASTMLVLTVSSPALAQGKTLTVRFYDDPAGFDPANIFRIENENIAFNIFSGLTTYDGERPMLRNSLALSAWRRPIPIR